MSFFESLRTATGGLTTNKLRATLTILGIIFGVGSVVALLSIGQGVRSSITNQIQSIGSNLLIINPERVQGSTRPSLLTVGDATALSDPLNAPAIAAVSPSLQGQTTATRGSVSNTYTVIGTNPSYATIRNVTLAMGGFLVQSDLTNQAHVAVIGWQVYSDLFPNGDYPIGQMITVDNVPTEVVGVIKQQGGFGGEDDSIVVPLTTAETRFFPTRTLSGDVPVGAIFVSVVDKTQVDAATQQITAILRQQHNLAATAQDDFRVTSQQAVLNVANQVTGVLTIFLGAIAGISLLVGGIGIMNIMLVSVTERTREVGIRKAVGATRRDVLLQFLLEAIVLSFLGGLLGIALGAGAAHLISNLDSSIATKVTVSIVGLAVGVATGVGVIFGVYPALRAANLRPIEALRYE